MAEAADEAFALLRKADRPVVLGDVLVQRYGVQTQLGRLLEKSGYPFAVLQLGKTLLSEQHPQFLGVYSGAASRQYVREYVEGADIILAAGTMLVDFNLGGFTANLRPERMIAADPDGVSIRGHCYPKVFLGDFLKELCDRFASVGRKDCPIRSAREELRRPISLEAAHMLTSKRFFERLGHFFPQDGIVVAESGNSLSSAAELLMPEGATFLSQTCYGSIGYAVGCALGAKIAGRGRPCTLVIGDGSLQVTAQELSVMIRYGLDIVVFVLNNDGYGVERLIHDGPYNDIAAWRYHKLPEAFGGGWSCEVRTEGELEEALAKATGRRGLSLIEVRVGRLDLPENLRRMCEAAAKADKLG
jgi:indolepyruvate decarboxylase